MAKKSSLRETQFEKFYRSFVRVFTEDPFEYAVNRAKAIPHGRLLGDFEVTDLLYEKVVSGKQLFINQEIISGERNRNAVMNFHYFNFYKYGKKVYNFRKELAELLLKTSLRKIDASYIKTPYPEIYLQVPTGIDFKIYDLEDDVHRDIEGIYVFFEDVDESGRRDFLIGNHTDEEMRKYDFSIDEDCKYFIRYVVVGKIETNEEYETETAYTNYYSIFLKEGDIFEQLRENNRAFSASALGFEPVPNINEIQSFIINALLYITCSNARVELFENELPYQGRNKSKDRKRNRGYSRVHEFYMVGDKTLAGAANSGAGLGTGGKVQTRFKVSPHWHTYWTGKDRKVRKLKWLTEYEKGKEFAEALEKNTTVVK